jgi:hypothetical protein
MAVEPARIPDLAKTPLQKEAMTSQGWVVGPTTPMPRVFACGRVCRLPKTQAALRTYHAQHSISRCQQRAWQCSCHAQPSRPPPVSPRPLPVSDGCSSHRLRAPPKPAARYTALRRSAYMCRPPEQPCVPKQEAPPGGRPPRGPRPSGANLQEDGRHAPPLPLAQLKIRSGRTRPASTTRPARTRASSPSPPREVSGARPLTTSCRGRRRRARAAAATSTTGRR